MNDQKLTRQEAEKILSKFKQGAEHHTTPNKDGDYQEYIFDTTKQKMVAYSSSFMDNSQRTYCYTYQQDEEFIKRVMENDLFEHFEKML